MKNDELLLCLITSQSARMKLDEFVRLFRHRNMLLLYFVPTLTLVVTNVRGAHDLPRWTVAGIYVADMFAFILSVIAMVWLLRRLIRRPAVLRLHMSPILCLGNVASTVTSEFLFVHFGQSALATPLEIGVNFLIMIVLTEVMFSIATRFIVPGAIAEMRAAATAPPMADPPQPVAEFVPPAVPPLPDTVTLAGRAVALGELRFVLAEGNAVQIAQGALTLRLPARFAAILAALPPGAGMQVHRSVWVSARHAAGASLHREGARTVLRLADGTRFPVAQSRRAEVAAWLRGLPA